MNLCTPVISSAQPLKFHFIVEYSFSNQTIKMFWRFNAMCSTNIDNLLNDEDITLQRLMDEDDIIQECKSNNTKLVNFMVKPEVLHELISLVTKEPSSHRPDAIRYKYNNIAAELFSCDVSLINDSVVLEDNLLAELSDFLYSESPLNPLMASFFSKTIAILIARKTDKMLEYLMNKEGFLTQLLKHLQTSAIMDLVLKLVNCVDNKDAKLRISQWLISEHFVERLIALLAGESEGALHGNVAQLLCDLLRLLRDTQAQNAGTEGDSQRSEESDLILSTLESKSTIDQLLEHMVGGVVSESSIVHGVTVLLTLLEVRRPAPSILSEPELVEYIPPDPVITPCIRNTVEAILPRMKDFHHILLNPPQKTPSAAQGSIVEKPLGFVRLQVARLITALLSTGSFEVQTEMASLGTLSVLMDMVQEFNHNNFLHAQVERSIVLILGLEPIHLLEPSQPSTGGEASDKKCESVQPAAHTHPLLSHLVNETCLIRRVLDAWDDNERYENKPSGRRMAYMGHIIRIANDIIELSKQGKNSVRIQELLDQLPNDLQLRWLEFKENELAQVNRNNEIVPVKSNMVAPRSSSDEEETDIIRHNLPKDTALQEVFSDYQMEVMSKHVVTQFGFNDSQFHDSDDQIRPPPDTLVNISLPEDGDVLTHQSAMFEQVCNERMQMGNASKNESDDDEDDNIWLERGRSNSSGNNTTTVRPQSSSDEEETLGGDEKDSMDVDQIDPWPSSTETVPIAMDAGNPWDNSSTAKEDGNESNWADFSMASFNEVNNTTPMEITDSLAITEQRVEKENSANMAESFEEQTALTEHPNGPV